MTDNHKIGIESNGRIFVTGHLGMVGSAVVRQLEKRGFAQILTASRHELDLRDQQSVTEWFAEHRPEYVIHAAGLVGGIMANSQRQADFLYDNLMIQANVLHAASRYAVKKLLNLGSSCVYPRDCPQPIREEYLLSGPLEATNYGYAIAKIAGIKACEAYRQQYGCHFISCMPCNLYGPGDNFDRETSHVLPGLIRKFDDARRRKDKIVTIWGSGQPRREFLYVDDLAEACLFLLENYDDAQTLNVGSGEEVTISQLANLIRDIVYLEASLDFDASKPDGTPRKVLDCNRIRNLGWRPRTSLRDGIDKTYQWYSDHSNGGVVQPTAKACQV
jgi:GDP-L-fucose synthase